MFLFAGKRPNWLYKKDNDKIVNALVDEVDAALRALKANEVDLSPKQKSKQKL